MIIKKNFPKPELFPVVFLLLFQFLFASTPMATALNQLANPNFAAAGTWTYDNNIVWGNLNTLAWQGAGYAFGNLTTNGRHRDGMVHLNFTAPAGVVNCYVRASHQDVWVAGFTSFALTGTLRDTTVGAYPNNGLMTTFLNEVTCNHAAWTPSGWSPIVQLVAGRTYKVQTYWNCNTTAGGDCGARLDDVYCNVSPRGLVANWNGSNVDLSWSASTGVGVLSKYIVYRSTTGVSGPYVLLKDNPGGTSWTDVAPAGSYYYTVSDVETVTGDESPQSIPAVPYTFPVRDGPGPDDITYSWLTDKVEANWPVATITVMGYEVAVGTSPGGTGVVPWTPVGSANKAEFTGLSLASGTTFYTTVRALDSNGEVMGTSKSNGFTIRGDQWLVDDDGAQCFYNRRVSELIDYSTAGEIKPALMSGGGGTGLWRFRKAITITEPGITERINAPCRVFFNIPANQPANVNEFRVTDEDGNELKRYNLPTGTTTNPDIVFIVNMKQGETKNYYVSWGNAGVSNPAYGFILGATQTSTIEWTPYYSRKLLSAGLETVPITTKFSAFDYGWDNTRDMEKPQYWIPPRRCPKRPCQPEYCQILRGWNQFLLVWSRPE